MVVLCLKVIVAMELRSLIESGGRVIVRSGSVEFVGGSEWQRYFLAYFSSDIREILLESNHLPRCLDCGHQQYEIAGRTGCVGCQRRSTVRAERKRFALEACIELNRKTGGVSK
mgnify:CR=1 FL=1